MAVFDFDPEHAPWWAFFVVLVIGVAATALIVFGMWVIGDRPSSGEVMLVVVPVFAGMGYVLRWLFILSDRRPPASGATHPAEGVEAMFCPYCGTHLVTVDHDQLMCAEGVVFTTHLSRLLTEVYRDGGTREPDGPSATRWGGRWFCPGCGVPTKERHGYVRCPSCQRSLDRFLYELIEHNPHEPSK